MAERSKREVALGGATATFLPISSEGTQLRVGADEHNQANKTARAFEVALCILTLIRNGRRQLSQDSMKTLLELSTAVLILVSGFGFAQAEMKMSSMTPSSHRKNSNIPVQAKLTSSQKAEAARQARELLAMFSKSHHKAAPQLQELGKQCVALLQPLSNPKFTDATETEAVKRFASFLREKAAALRDPKIYSDGRSQLAVERVIILSGGPPQEYYCFVYCGHEYYYLIKGLTKL